MDPTPPSPKSPLPLASLKVPPSPKSLPTPTTPKASSPPKQSQSPKEQPQSKEISTQSPPQAPNIDELPKPDTKIEDKEDMASSSTQKKQKVEVLDKSMRGDLKPQPHGHKKLEEELARAKAELEAVGSLASTSHTHQAETHLPIQPPQMPEMPEFQGTEEEEQPRPATGALYIIEKMEQEIEDMPKGPAKEYLMYEKKVMESAALAFLQLEEQIKDFGSDFLPLPLMRHEANLWKEKMRPAVPRNEDKGYLNASLLPPLLCSFNPSACPIQSILQESLVSLQSLGLSSLRCLYACMAFELGFSTTKALIHLSLLKRLVYSSTATGCNFLTLTDLQSCWRPTAIHTLFNPLYLASRIQSYMTLHLFC
ncbi:hypothetical protein L7F22_039696 [Adiantum nelumboides]|nr:hypothetical protein [Adiantum nelumboides]